MNQKNFIESTSKQFQYYKHLGEKAIAQLDDEEIFDEDSAWVNNVAVIVKHLHGNMMSRWTDFLDSDGEKEWRERDGEFDFDVKNREEMMKLWEEGWSKVFSALQQAKSANNDQLVYIRNQGHTIAEAILRQVTHYAYHVGQIVYIAKLQREKNWISLSIPRGESKSFNKNKFKQAKSKGHFTDDFFEK